MTRSIPSAPAPRLTAFDAPLEAVTFDLYRDIHKGIRAELFAVTEAAGRLDPGDEDELARFRRRLDALVGLLASHAEHEDRYLTPLLVRADASLAATVTGDHGALESRLGRIVQAVEAISRTAASARRLAVHRLYLGIASFTADYLEHQDMEELQIMPVLATGVTIEELLAVHAEILGSIPPAEMAASLALLLPAMNVADRAEMLLGMRASAPPPVFDGVVAIARDVLAPADFRALSARIADA